MTALAGTRPRINTFDSALPRKFAGIGARNRGATLGRQPNCRAAPGRIGWAAESAIARAVHPDLDDIAHRPGISTAHQEFPRACERSCVVRNLRRGCACRDDESPIGSGESVGWAAPGSRIAAAPRSTDSSSLNAAASPPSFSAGAPRSALARSLAGLARKYVKNRSYILMVNPPPPSMRSKNFPSFATRVASRAFDILAVAQYSSA